MDYSICRKTLSIVLLFVAVQMYGQKNFDLNVAEVSFTIEGKSLTGYKTGFDFTREEVRKGWWKYAKQFGSPLDMRSYYRVKIPSEATDGNIDLIIYSTTVYENGHSVFSMGLTEDKYKVQLQKLMADFKRGFYIDHYAGLIKMKQLEAQSVADQYERSYDKDEKGKLLDKLQGVQREVQGLMNEIRKVGS